MINNNEYSDIQKDYYYRVDIGFFLVAALASIFCSSLSGIKSKFEFDVWFYSSLSSSCFSSSIPISFGFLLEDYDREWESLSFLPNDFSECNFSFD